MRRINTWRFDMLTNLLCGEFPFVNEREFTILKFKNLWENIYRVYFEMKVDFSDLHIPECPGFPSDYWLIIAAEGLTPQKIFNACGKIYEIFGRWVESLDERIISVHSSRNCAYAGWIKAGFATKEERFENIYAEKLIKSGYQGITVEEGMLLEILARRVMGGCTSGSLCIGSYVQGVKERFVPEIWFSYTRDWRSGNKPIFNEMNAHTAHHSHMIHEVTVCRKIYF
jgi:hypothetical protein